MSRFSFVIATLALTPLVTVAAAGGIAQGPFVGHVTPRTASVWARCSAQGTYELTLIGPGQDGGAAHPAVADDANDRCVVWEVRGLAPGVRYHYLIARDGVPLAAGPQYSFETAPAAGAPARVRLAFGSCAFEDDAASRVWERIEREHPDAVVLLGDTPYIDTTDLPTQRRRYREFASVKAMRRLLARRPLYATWDDHDFGLNDTDGNLPGKENARQAFIEYHAHASYGDGSNGIFTQFRRGPLHVFLLDTRWFAATEPSPVDPAETTLLGAAQWEWLTEALLASTAPFKVIACGMIWNEAVRPGKTDHWGTYAHERDALFAFLGDEGITGVVLVGGDIHRSRVIRHDVAKLAGEDVIELIVSPMHHHIIAEANAPHPGLIVDMGEPHTFMTLTADTTVTPASLAATFMNADGDVHFEIELGTEVGLGESRP